MEAKASPDLTSSSSYMWNHMKEMRGCAKQILNAVSETMFVIRDLYRQLTTSDSFTHIRRSRDFRKKILMQQAL
jgi:hypothetical protein